MWEVLAAFVEVVGAAIKDWPGTVRLCVILIVMAATICITALVLR